MEFFKKYNITPLKVVKSIGVIIVGIVILSVVYALLSSTLGGINSGIRFGNFSVSPEGTGGSLSYDQGVSKSYAPVYDSSYESYPDLSTRNILPSPIPSQTSGDDAENYEVSDYAATFETHDREKTCKAISDLKAKDYVIFENSNQYDKACDFVFKVKHTNVEEVLAIIKSLDPKDLSENVRTIKQVVDDYTSEVEVLTKKKQSIEETLDTAIAAYNDITKLATDTRDADALAKVIDSKIKTIERLTAENITVTEQLDRLARARTQELDKIDYTYFRISVYEVDYIDGEQILDSWKYAIKDFVQTLNEILQGITLGLIGMILFAVQYLLYLFLVVFIIKFAWKFTKDIWNR